MNLSMRQETFQLEIYQDAKGKRPFVDWIISLKNTEDRAKINARLARLRTGNLGDYKSVGEGVYELRIDTGPGYRIYFAHRGNNKLILLGGTKRAQLKDIARARDYLMDYRRR